VTKSLRRAPLRFQFLDGISKVFSRGTIHGLVIIICLFWLSPTVGLLVSSFRTRSVIAASGWWTSFQTPFQFTLENYQEVLFQEGMGRSFLNSLLIAIPSTTLTILVAALQPMPSPG